MTATLHARQRLQQRSIPPLITDWLQDFGATLYDSHGAQVRYFDKQARRRLEREVGRLVVRRLSDFLDCYVVLSDGVLVTAGWRFKRLRRP